jgi:hypothetical protein
MDFTGVNVRTGGQGAKSGSESQVKFKLKSLLGCD